MKHSLIPVFSLVFCIGLSGADRLIMDFKQQFAKLPETKRSTDKFVKVAPALKLFQAEGKGIAWQDFFLFSPQTGKKLILNAKILRAGGGNPLILTVQAADKENRRTVLAQISCLPKKENTFEEIAVPFEMPAGELNFLKVLLETRAPTTWIIDEIQLHEAEPEKQK